MIPSALIPGAEWLPVLAQLALKATLILLVTAGAAALLWRSSAAARHMVWCTGVAAVLALPLLAAVLPAWELRVLPPEAPAFAAPAVSAPAVNASAAGTPSVATSLPPATEPLIIGTPREPVSAWLPRAAVAVAAWGVAAGVLWLALGFWGVARLGRRAQVVRDPEWLASVSDAAERLELRRPVLLLRARGAVMPATGGLLWPSVVIPASADQWPDERRHAVLAHELAHVKRFDTLTQALAQVACVLFWWHPAVWYAAKRLRVERERACDDLVLRAGTRASDYASHLLEIARTHRGPRIARTALVSMARPSQLESRLLWVLDGARARGVPSSRATLLTVAMALLIVVPLSAMRAAPASSAPGHEPASSLFSAVLGEDEAQDSGTAHGKEGGRRGQKGRDGDAPYGVGVDAGIDADIDAAVDAAVDVAVDGNDATLDRLLDRARDGRAARRPGDTIPTVEELVAMRAVGVDAQYIQEMRGAGYGNLTPQQLISMRAAGVSARFAAEMREAGFGRLDVDDLVSLRALNVTPAYVAELRRYGYTRLTAEQVSGMRAVNVNGDYLDLLRRHGYTGLSADQVQGMRAVGIDPAYIEQINAAGFGRLSAEDLTSFRALGVTPEYLAQLERLGLGRMSADDVQGLRALNVDARYVESIRAAGLRPLDARTLTELRAVGVTPEYIRELAGVGLTGLTIRQLTELRAQGVTAAYVRELRAAGFRELSVSELIQLRASGVDRELMRSRGSVEAGKP